MRINRLWVPIIALAAATACAESEGVSSDTSTPARASAPAEPSAGDREYAELTASWSDEAFEGCGRTLQEALGTRDLVQGALDGVSDPSGRAAAELEDARHWFEAGNGQLEDVRPALRAGTCNPDITVALDEAVQAYIKAGTAAVQAKTIAEG